MTGASRERVEQALVDSQLLNTLLETMPEFVYFKDRERRFVRVSRSFEALVGRSTAEILGRCDEELFPLEIAEASARDDERVITTGEPIVNKLEGGVLADGQETWVLTTKFPWRSAEGTIQGLCGISRRFTDMKRLLDGQQRAEQILDQIHDSVISTDLEGRITSWNRGGEVLFGRTAEEMIGQPIASVYPPEETDAAGVSPAAFAFGSVNLLRAG